MLFEKVLLILLYGQRDFDGSSDQKDAFWEI